MKLRTLIYYEMKKVFSHRIALLLLIIAAAFMLIVSSQRYIVSPEERHAAEAERDLEGRPMNDAFFEELSTWQKDEQTDTVKPPWRFAGIYAGRVFWFNDNKSRGAYDDWSEEAFYGHRQQAVAEFTKEFSLTEDERSFWDDQEATIEKPFIYHSTRDIQNLREVFQFAMTLACLLIGILLSESFAEESTKKADAILFSSRHGHGHTLLSKLIAGTLVAILTGCVLLLAAGVPVVLFSGLHGLSAPWYMVEPLSSFTMHAGTMVALHTLVFLLGCVLVGLFTMLLSLLLNHAVASMGMIFAVVIADLFLSVPTKLRTLSQIRYLTPISALMNTRVQDMRLVKMFGKYLISLQAAPLLYMLCCIVLIIATALVFYRRCVKR